MIWTVDVGKKIRIQGQGCDASDVNPKRRVLTEFSGRFRGDFDFPSCFRTVPPRACRGENYREYVASVAMSKATQAKRDVPLA
jgi:hypothetical protein